LAAVDDLAVRALGTFAVGRRLQRGGQTRQPLEVPLGRRGRFHDHGVVRLRRLGVPTQMQSALPDDEERFGALLALELGDGLGGLERRLPLLSPQVESGRLQPRRTGQGVLRKIPPQRGPGCLRGGRPVQLQGKLADLIES
jgi:hypothetical protein